MRSSKLLLQPQASHGEFLSGFRNKKKMRLCRIEAVRQLGQCCHAHFDSNSERRSAVWFEASNSMRISSGETFKIVVHNTLDMFSNYNPRGYTKLNSEEIL
ncbi:hypothetical protein TNCT_723411 [Trichonephila clavata]|uniref:Uncharacterized protein n=1 Tax=Trichonephila clavata TaxID=2740835 RepID=A0A8X6KNZ0_TRICU|nr:hypothetical protein TNCT_723411 [Trichonephila clavata]